MKWSFGDRGFEASLKAVAQLQEVDFGIQPSAISFQLLTVDESDRYSTKSIAPKNVSHLSVHQLK
jgi:hypothetical protein